MGLTGASKHNTSYPRGLLSGIRVLDLGQRISGPYCTKRLANLGAEVIKVEPPSGDESRAMGPFPAGRSHLEKSGLFLALNANKYSVVLDLSSPEDVRRLLKLAETVDIIVDNHHPGQLEAWGCSYDTLCHSNKQIILTSITPFGTWGPYSDFKATDLTLYHMTGHAHSLLGPVEDPNSDPPIRAGGHQTEFVAGLTAATVSLMALYRRRMGGTGCHIIVSSFDAMATQAIAGLAACAFGRPTPSRDLNVKHEAAIGGVVSAVGGVLPCTDGYVAISPREDAQWKRWLDVMGNPSWSSDDRFATREGRQANFPDLWQLISRWSRNYSKHEIAQKGQNHRIPCFPVNTVEDLMSNNHLKERQFFITMDHPYVGSLKYPGEAYKLSNEACNYTTHPAPLLGQHNDLILSQLGK